MINNSKMMDVPITTGDIVEMVHERNKGNIHKTISGVNNIVAQIEQGAKFFTMSLQDELKMLADMYTKHL